MTQLNAPTDLHSINTGLESLTASFCAVQEENSTAKEILYLSVKKCLPVILEASPSKLRLEVLPNYVSLLKTGFLSLRKHVGKELLPHFKVSLQSTMSLFNPDIFSVLTESAQGPRLLEDVIELFSEIVQDTSKVFESSLPELILFCENQMQNHILSVKARIFFCLHRSRFTITHIPIYQAPEFHQVKLKFYEFVFKILFYHWRYFFGSTLKVYLGTPTLSSPPKTKSVSHSPLQEGASHSETFVQLIQILVKAFSETETEFLSQSLSHLSRLNDRFFLYSKPFFQQVLLGPFVGFFLDILVSGNHDLVREEILEHLVKLVLVDKSRFQKEVVHPIFAFSFNTNPQHYFLKVCKSVSVKTRTE